MAYTLSICDFWKLSLVFTTLIDPEPWHLDPSLYHLEGRCKIPSVNFILLVGKATENVQQGRSKLPYAFHWEQRRIQSNKLVCPAVSWFSREAANLFRKCIPLASLALPSWWQTAKVNFSIGILRCRWTNSLARCVMLFYVISWCKVSLKLAADSNWVLVKEHSFLSCRWENDSYCRCSVTGCRKHTINHIYVFKVLYSWWSAKSTCSAFEFPIGCTMWFFP